MGFDSVRERACQSQRRKREAGFEFDPAREGACQSQRGKREAGFEFDPAKGYVKLGQRKGQKTENEP